MGRLINGLTARQGRPVLTGAVVLLTQVPVLHRYQSIFRLTSSLCASVITTMKSISFLAGKTGKYISLA
jgi:hypothetical protein